MMSSPIAGYNSVFFMRADYQDIQARNNNRTSEWIWAPSTSLGMSGATYAGIIYAGYCTIGGLDVGGNDAPVMDDITLEDYNVGSIVELVVNRVQDAVSKYPQGQVAADGTADVLLPIGCDFAWENGATVYTNMDKVRGKLDRQKGGAGGSWGGWGLWRAFSRPAPATQLAHFPFLRRRSSTG
jgi:hypothetical protein